MLKSDIVYLQNVRNSTPTAPQQHPNSTPTAPQQHPNSTPTTPHHPQNHTSKTPESPQPANRNYPKIHLQIHNNPIAHPTTIGKASAEHNCTHRENRVTA